jgi:hypothetical protein
MNLTYISGRDVANTQQRKNDSQTERNLIVLESAKAIYLKRVLQVLKYTPSRVAYAMAKECLLLRGLTDEPTAAIYRAVKQSSGPKTT